LERQKPSSTASHHELLRLGLAAGLAAARDRLVETPAASTRIELQSITRGTIGDLDPEQVSPGLSGDVIAAVVQRFHGPPSGTALFALEPGDALLWLQRGDSDQDPLACFVDWGSRVIAGVVESLATAWESEVELGEPRLEERSLMAALLGMHAPGDTVVLSLHGELTFPMQELGRDLSAPFSIHVLLEPKLVDGILSRLAEGGVPEVGASVAL
jgi:hypothetical protein